MTLQERADLYRAAFPKFQPLSVVKTADGGERIEGVWFMGQNYTVKSGYYGGYPHGYLDRVMSMFPCGMKKLHLFSGQVEGRGDTEFTFDISPNIAADIKGNAENLSQEINNWMFAYRPDEKAWRCRKCFELRVVGCGCEKFDLILADPPYSAEDAEHYGTPMINRSKVLKECFKVLRPGGWVIWLDQVFPMFRKDEFHLGMVIAMIKSTNHRVRAVFGFQKVSDDWLVKAGQEGTLRDND